MKMELIFVAIVSLKHIFYLERDLRRKCEKNLSYGKIQDNIFVEEVIEGDLENISNLESITEYIKKLSNEQKETLKKRNLSDTGLFFQRIYYLSEIEEEQYYSLNISTVETTCTLDYFKNFI